MDVLVLESDVSDNPFSVAIGSHQVVFNTEADLCKVAGCDDEQEEDTWRVARGDAFELKETGGEILELRNEPDRIGYLTRVRLDDLIAKGHVTRTDEQHPRYRITKSEFEKFATQCGQRAASELKLAPGEIDLAKKVISGFDIGTLNGDRVALTTYGKAQEKIVFRVYAIEDTWPADPNLPMEEKSFYVVAAFTYACEPANLGRDHLKYIANVKYWSSRKPEKSPELSIDDSDFQTPKNLFPYTGAPYLISINSTAHYEKAIEVISELLEDRALAGYALSEINRSCASKYRKTKCQRYRYPPTADPD